MGTWTLRLRSLGVRVWGLGLRFGFRVEGLGFGAVWGLGFWVRGLGLGIRVPGSGFGVEDLGFTVWGFGYTGFRVTGLSNSSFRVMDLALKVLGREAWDITK